MSHSADTAGESLTTANGRTPPDDSTGGMIDLACALLVGRDGVQDVRAGVEWLARAADLGDANALERLATTTAVGVTAPADWPAALDLLQRAAEHGSARAQGQIRLLSQAPGESASSWAELRASMDVGWWMTAPSRTPLLEAPRVRSAENFAPAAVCDWLIARARGRMRQAMMYDGTTKTEQVDPHRTCSDYQFDILNTDLVVQLVREKIAAATRLPTPAMEPPRIFHYALGQDIKAHFDRCGDGVGGYGESGYQGDRIVTFLLYLNDDYDGGELQFPKTGFMCKGAKGDAIYFAHVDTSGKQDPLSLHAGLKVTRGEKWVMSQWIHDRPFGVPS
jgi:predicted 2-oxoglutarate/Fe(II)-dependent dioxygenase YbiX